MAAYQYIYVMKGLGKTYPGGREVLRDIRLSFLPGAKIGVLGLNGAGKSTLLRIMAGQERDFVGEAWAAEGVRVGYLPQEPVLDPDKDVAGNVTEGLAETKALLERFEAVSARFAEDLSPEEMEALIAEQGELQEKIDQADAWELDRTVEIAMYALRCPPGEAAVETLSGGERRRVALCRLLLQRPDLLLLDEPTNHLDAESVAWLQRFLRDYPGTVVTVTHDRYFLDEVAGWILELDRGRGIPFEGTYSGWLEQKQARPDTGEFRIGETVKLGYVDQSRDTLGGNNTVWQEISGGQDEIDLGRRKIASRAYCALFNFRGPDQQKKVGQLSGGERNRVHLAKMLKQGANVLLLDEPTNDLDIDTLRALEEALLEYPGCAAIITHDRWFLDRIATHILAFEGDSEVEWFEGNYADYEADRRRRRGADADQPHRIRYKPLTRN